MRLRNGEAEGLTPDEAVAVARFRRVILQVALEEMGHLAAVWNITAALGGAPRFGRGNFPLDPGYLPAGVVVKLAPFGEAVLQHFIHLERPEGSLEPEGSGFEPEFLFKRGLSTARLIPMAVDYETVGAFYAFLHDNLRAFVDEVGESAAFCGDPALQLSQAEVNLPAARPVICSKTALAAFTASWRCATARSPSIPRWTGRSAYGETSRSRAAPAASWLASNRPGCVAVVAATTSRSATGATRGSGFELD